MSISSKKSITDCDIKGKRVFIRVDFNVVSAVTGQVDDETRVKFAAPTIQYAIDNGAKSVVIASHCGRPDGKKVEKFSLKPVVAVLEKYISKKVSFVPDCVGSKTEEAVNAGSDGAVFLLENLRFHLAEEGVVKAKDGTKTEATAEEVAAFRKGLTALGDIFVLDAFGTAHRAHSSIVGVDLPRVSGLLLAKELQYFSMVLEEPKRPFVAILGGSKVKDKIQVIKSLLSKVDEVIVGGGMAYTFLKVMNGMEIGNSLYDKVGAEVVPEIIATAAKNGVKIHLPVDFSCGDDFKPDCNVKVVTADEGIPAGWEGFDAGPQTILNFQKVIGGAKLICWNGPMGVFEFDCFSKGSKAVLDSICSATANGCITVVGGGDSAALTTKYDRASQMSHVSTGGGASLELLEGKTLPGVAALDSK